MMRHIVVLRWSDEATASQKRAAEAGFAVLPESIPQIRALRCGPDLGLGPGNHDFAAELDFDTVEDWRAYQESPAHKDFVTRTLKPILAGRAAIQFDAG
ncbi:Dabb family protein [Actinomadura luteofluorescens]|uniref:Dabb family protein n=1 Tax=Actinomadura luteofluorescens TaxID=46163 RepID=UPI002164BBFD|nr:Dabb family protein [Actinomadura glauciflava]MCR3740774.1 Stress responsive A/B Barrel Domain [Actinomadura glauciflava]